MVTVVATVWLRGRKRFAMPCRSHHGARRSRCRRSRAAAPVAPAASSRAEAHQGARRLPQRGGEQAGAESEEQAEAARAGLLLAAVFVDVLGNKVATQGS